MELVKGSDTDTMESNSSDWSKSEIEQIVPWLEDPIKLRRTQKGSGETKSIGSAQLHLQFPPVLRHKSDINMTILRSHTVKPSSLLINLDGALGKKILSMEILYLCAVRGNLN